MTSAVEAAAPAAPVPDNPDAEATHTSDGGPNGLGTPTIKGSFAAAHPPVEPFPILVAPSFPGRGKNTIKMELIPLACWRLNSVRFAFGSSFVLPESREDFYDLSQLRKAHPGAPLSIFGHADPVGDVVANKKLSGHRAESIYAVLIRDCVRWENLYSEAGQNEGWGIESLQRMLGALGYGVGPATGAMNSQTVKAVETFQTVSDLRVDGNPGPKTRAKLFVAYMDFLCPDKVSKPEFLAGGVDPNGKGDFQGCGEFNPVMSFSSAELKYFSRPEHKDARDAENEVNRRVMVLLFRPGTSVPSEKWPCPRTSEGVGGCLKRFWSDSELRRAPTGVRREFGETKNTFACRFYQRLVAESPCEGVDSIQHWIQIVLRDEADEPIRGTRYRIQLPDGKSVFGRLDEYGKARHDGIPGGICHVTFPDLDEDAWGVS